MNEVPHLGRLKLSVPSTISIQINQSNPWNKYDKAWSNTGEQRCL